MQQGLPEGIGCSVTSFRKWKSGEILTLGREEIREIRAGTREKNRQIMNFHIPEKFIKPGTDK